MRHDENQRGRGNQKILVTFGAASTACTLCILACGSSSPPLLAGNGGAASDESVSLDGGAFATSEAPEDDASSGGPDAEAPSRDASLDAASLDAETYVDAPTIDRQSGATCNSKWWATNSAFDPTVTPSFASAMNPIVGSSSIHPFTLAMQVAEDGGWTGMASGTAMDGNGNEYFPGAYPSSMAAMTVTSASVATTTPEVSAWFHVHDAGGNDVWIPIASVALSATYGDPGCGTLTEGSLTAVIQASASLMAIQPIGQSLTRLGALLGARTSTVPAGWNVRMTFDAAAVQVD